MLFSNTLVGMTSNAGDGKLMVNTSIGKALVICELRHYF
jgi:hypothetical protein